MIEYEGDNNIMTDDKAPVELLGMEVKDGINYKNTIHLMNFIMN